mmetsp:Transcript_32158/g.76454  ORF Transcript_32158/g.76454 Transcript_32158/m.76454 type:complete len:401 (+) Transcript_32158:54-1256(+)
MARTNKKNRRRKAQAEDNYENQLEVGTVLDTSGVGETSGANVEVLQRWETHFSKKLRQDIMGVELKLEQSPGSDHLGTTVWDASIVLAKYLEKNAARGPLSRRAVKGKTVIELGAGVGLAGLSAALLQPKSVSMTDTAEMLPLMRRNVEKNLGREAPAGTAGVPRVGADVPVPECVELDWRDAGARGRLGTFDFVIAADCVYHPGLAESFLRTLQEVAHKKTVVLLANEKRSRALMEGFLADASNSFRISPVPQRDLDPSFSHDEISLVLLTKRASPRCSDASRMDNLVAAQCHDIWLWDDLTSQRVEDAAGTEEEHEPGGTGSADNSGVCLSAVGAGAKIDGSVWAARREGAAAARMLSGISVSERPMHTAEGTTEHRPRQGLPKQSSRRARLQESAKP